MAKELQAAKSVVLEFHAALDRAADDEVECVLNEHTTDDHAWRGMHPFYEQPGAAAVTQVFWTPLRRALSPIQRRPTIFLAGYNDVQSGGDHTPEVWVCEMGHFMGLFDQHWLGIPPTGKITFLSYAEFSRVAAGKIAETALFCDVIGVMQQAGQYPLPPQTGAAFIHPAPRTQDGLLFDNYHRAESVATMNLVNRMIDDLNELNKRSIATGDDSCPPQVLAKTWRDDMAWYGPAGIGATYTIPRYQKQHQMPFRQHLYDKVFNGHVARFAEGNYACFFGWANLTNRARGGFLGLPGNDTPADMRVVDVYRREGDKLAENWVFIDVLHYLSMQGLDVLTRMRDMLHFPGQIES